MSSEPTPYERESDFASFEASNPDSPKSAVSLDAEFNEIVRVTGELISRLAEIQRADGAVKNDSIGLDQLKNEVSEQLGGTVVMGGDLSGNAADATINDDAVDDAKIGDRTVVQATAAADTGTLTAILSSLANRLKAITGEADWKTDPAATITELNDSLTDALGAIAALDSGKADASHTHAISEITNLQTTLDDLVTSGGLADALADALDGKFDKTGGALSGDVEVTGSLSATKRLSGGRVAVTLGSSDYAYVIDCSLGNVFDITCHQNTSDMAFSFSNIKAGQIVAVRVKLAALSTVGGMIYHFEGSPGQVYTTQSPYTGMAITGLIVTTSEIVTAVFHAITDSLLFGFGYPDFFFSLDVHANQTSGTHGLIGDIVGTTDSQKITDKNIIGGFNAQTGTTYTLALTDAYKSVTLTNASAITLTVPPNSSVAFDIGTVITLDQLGAGQVTVAPGSGVTINSRGSAFKLVGQYSTAGLKKIATDTWLFFGDITA